MPQTDKQILTEMLFKANIPYDLNPPKAIDVVGFGANIIETYCPYTRIRTARFVFNNCDMLFNIDSTEVVECSCDCGECDED